MLGRPAAYVGTRRRPAPRGHGRWLHSRHRPRPTRCRRRPWRWATASSAARAAAATRPSPTSPASPRASPAGRPPTATPTSATARPTPPSRWPPCRASRSGSTWPARAPSRPTWPRASSARPAGRTVAAQIDQLRAVAQTGDIDLVLLGLGSNNSQFTFGGVAAECAGRFVADGYTGWWEVWIHFINWVTGAELNERACSDADFATAAEVAAARAETDGRRAPGARRARRDRRRRPAPGGAAGLHQPAAAGLRRAVPHRGRPQRHPRQVPRARRREVRRGLPRRHRLAGTGAPVQPEPRQHRVGGRVHAPGRATRRRASPTSTCSAPSTGPGCARSRAARATHWPRRCG